MRIEARHVGLTTRHASESMPSWPREYYKSRGGRKEDDDRIVCLCDGIAGDDMGRCDFCERRQRWCREVQNLNRGC
jgi:hypothetical protein